MSFRITGLSVEPFEPLFGLSDEALARAGARRVAVDTPTSAPCRVTLADAAPGETVILLNSEHQPADTPFRSRHAIYVREGAETPFDAVDEVPPALRVRTLSVRAFDGAHMMIDADLVEGEDLAGLLDRYLGGDQTAYVQIHYARRGCFAATAVRA